MTKPIVISSPYKIEGEGLDVDYVVGFVEFVYGAVTKADSASSLCGHLAETVDILEGRGMPATEVTRFRARVERACRVADHMEADARSVLMLVPVLMEAAGFDPGLDRASAQWTKAATKVGRVDEGWTKIVGYAIPIARRAMGLAIVRLAAGGKRSRVIGGLDVAAAIELFEGGQNAVADEPNVDHTVVRAVDYAERFVTGDNVSDLAAVAGAVGHTMARDAATLVVRRPDDQSGSIVVSSERSGEAIAVMSSSRSVADGEPLRPEQQDLLRELGFRAPGRTEVGGLWTAGVEGRDPVLTSLCVTRLLHEVHGVGPRTRLEMSVHEVNAWHSVDR